MGWPRLEDDELDDLRLLAVGDGAVAHEVLLHDRHDDEDEQVARDHDHRAKEAEGLLRAEGAAAGKG
eukprot:5897665-Prymnesium_polylepis.1